MLAGCGEAEALIYIGSRDFRSAGRRLGRERLSSSLV